MRARRSWIVDGGSQGADRRRVRPPSYRLLSTILYLLSTILLLVGCYQEMSNQPRYEAYEASAFFADSLSARPLVAGTVPRGAFVGAGAYYTGTDTGSVAVRGVRAGMLPGPPGLEDRLVRRIPFPVTASVLARGRQAFDVYCAPCHGRTGYGNGMIVQRGLRAPPSFHTERLRNAPDGHFFDVITNGYGAMYGYAGRVDPADRWAIVAYVRALQLSQHAPPGLVDGGS